MPSRMRRAGFEEPQTCPQRGEAYRRMDAAVFENAGSPSLKYENPPPPCQPTACEMPPCSPSTTLLSRGRQCVRACSPISMPIQRRPILCATAAVVPEPRNESRTRSSGLVAMWRILCIRRSGFGVPKTSSPNNSTTSRFASCVCPTSSYDHHVWGTIPCFTSVRSAVELGIAAIFPDHIRLSASSSRSFDSATLQNMAFGGPAIIRPLGVVIG